MTSHAVPSKNGTSNAYSKVGAGQALAAVVPGAKSHTLPGQTHMVKAGVIAPVVAEFFAKH